MSVEDAKLFYQKVNESGKLQEKVKNIIDQERKLLNENIVTLGKQSGFDFNEKNLEQLSLEFLHRMGEEGSLSDSSLETVTGGHSAAHVIKEFIENVTGQKIVIPITKIFK